MLRSVLTLPSMVAAVIGEVRKTKPHVYLQVVASLLPRQVTVEKLSPVADLSDEEIEQLEAFLASSRAKLVPKLEQHNGADRLESAPLHLESDNADADPPTPEVPPLLACVRYQGKTGRHMLIARFSHFGRVEMWRGGCRPNISVCRLFRVAVP